MGVRLRLRGRAVTEEGGGTGAAAGPVTGRGWGTCRHVGSAAALRPQVPEGPGVGSGPGYGGCAPRQRRCAITASPPLRESSPHFSRAPRVLAAAPASPEFSCNALYPFCISSRFSLRLPESLI